MGSGLDPSYVALLGLADSFLRSGKSGTLAAIKCLRAIFQLNPPPPPFVIARTHLQLGIILRRETTNQATAMHHLQQAWAMSQDQPQIADVRSEAASVLCDMYCKDGRVVEAKQLLLKGMETSQVDRYWHCRLLFQAAGIHAQEKDYLTAINYLTMGVDYAYMAGATYTRMLFLLSKAMLFLLERKFAEANPILHQTGPMIEAWSQSNTHQTPAVAKQQKEYLQIFFLVLQVCYYLMVGQVKSVKTVLKQLQQSIQTITSPEWPSDEDMISANPADHFQWLSKDQLCILVYLVTVMHSMQAGYMDKAQKYTDKAIAQIDKLRALNVADDRRTFPPPLLSSFHVLLMEHVIQCRLVTGNKAGAIQELGNLCRLLDSNPVLLQRHRAQLHTMLGLYAMSMNCMENAEQQLNAALRTSQERELWTFANLNLAIVYLRTRRETDFMQLMDRIAPERLPSQSHSLQAAAFYIQGLHAFFTAKYNESKRFLRETLKMANAEDLNRLTSCSLVLLGHIFLSLGNSRESMNMVTPAMQLASKIPDAHVQLWASSILKDLHRLMEDPVREQEGVTMHTNFSQMLLSEHLSASQLPEHNLINWTEGPFPALPISSTVPATPPIRL